MVTVCENQVSSKNVVLYLPECVIITLLRVVDVTIRRHEKTLQAICRGMAGIWSACVVGYIDSRCVLCGGVNAHLVTVDVYDIPLGTIAMHVPTISGRTDDGKKGSELPIVDVCSRNGIPPYYSLFIIGMRVS